MEMNVIEDEQAEMGALGVMGFLYKARMAFMPEELGAFGVIQFLTAARTAGMPTQEWTVTQTVTPAGVGMSPRMQRVYGFLATNGARLTPFSTDQDVLHHCPAINAAITKLEAAIAIKSTAERIDCLADLRAIAGRVPAARVTAQPAGGAVVNERTRGALDDLVALGESSPSTGALVMWTLRGTVAVDTLTNAWVAAGLPRKWAPQAPSARVALTRAVESLTAGGHFSDSHPKGGRVIVHKGSTPEGELTYRVGTRFWLTTEKGMDFESAPDQLPAEAQADAEIVARAFRAARDTVTTKDLGDGLVDFVAHLGGVSVRETGGVYFVSAAAEKQFRAAQAVLAAHTQSRLYCVPAARGADILALALEGVSRESAAAIAGWEADLTAGVTIRESKSRIEAIDQLAMKVRNYSLLLKADLKSTETTLQTLRARFAATQTRTSQLEID